MQAPSLFTIRNVCGARALFMQPLANQGYCVGTQIQPFGYIRDLVAGKKEAAEDAPASS